MRFPQPRHGPAARLGSPGIAALFVLAAGCAPDDPTAPPQQPTDARPIADAPLSSAVPTAGLVGEWKLDGNVTDTKTGGTAALVGNPPYLSAKIGQGVDLTGNGTDGNDGQYVQLQASTTLHDLSKQAAYSISAWFNPKSAPSGTAPANFWMVVGKTNNQAIGIVYNPAGKFAARHYLDGNILKLATATSTSSTNQWHHVAAVVTKGTTGVANSGTLKLYVDGLLSQTETWTGGVNGKNFDTARWRIGQSDDDWAANGRVDQVRFYNVALSAAQVDSLTDEGDAPAFPYPLSMTKGQDTTLIGDDPMPDGQMASQNSVTMSKILKDAHQKGRRLTIRVTPDNGALVNNTTQKLLDVTKWTDAFDIKRMDTLAANFYFSEGTLVALMAIDEPTSDFNGVTGAQLDALCQHVKSYANWDQVPCMIRELNTKLVSIEPTNGYDYVDGGWAQIADHHYDTEYNNDMSDYFTTNLEIGQQHGLGLMLGFNLINGGREISNCTRFDNSNHNCAMRATEIEELADVVAAIGDDQGCGINGWWINPTDQAERNWYFSQGAYANNGIQDALDYLNSKLSGLRPGPCIR